MPPTILSVLSRENPTLYPRNIQPASNTLGKCWLDFDDVKPWSEFNYTKLRKIYKDVVEAPWNNPPPPAELSILDSTYGDEDGFEHQILSRDTVPDVNSALRHAKRLCKYPNELNLGRRGRCSYDEDGRLNPDWTLISDDYFLDDGSFTNILPGDTKLSARWWPDLYRTNREQWERPIRQVLTYSNEVQRRYGFFITDNELVVFQFTRELVGPGLANTRGTRTPNASQTHQRIHSDDSQLSSSVRAMSLSMSMSIGSSGAQSYVESGKGFEYQDPKYQLIPWANHGKGVLTVRLALFYLCLMAGYGSGDVRMRYPKLDTWYRLTNGNFQHSTTGFVKKKLGSKDKFEDLNSDGDVMDAEEETEEVEYDEGGEYEQYQSGTRRPSGEDEYMGHQDEDEEVEVEEEDLMAEEEDELDRKGKAKARRKEGGKSVRLPKLKSSKPTVEAEFEFRKDTPYFKSRNGERVEVKGKEWKEMEHNGRRVMVYEGRKTNYVTDQLPTKVSR